MESIVLNHFYKSNLQFKRNKVYTNAVNSYNLQTEWHYNLYCSVIRYNTIWNKILSYFSKANETVYKALKCLITCWLYLMTKTLEAVVLTMKSQALCHSPQKKSSNTTLISNINLFLCPSIRLPTSWISHRAPLSEAFCHHV
jgi:hypothetical protein